MHCCNHSPPKAIKTKSPGEVPFCASAGDLTEHQCPTLTDLINSKWVNTQIQPH